VEVNTANERTKVKESIEIVHPEEVTIPAKYHPAFLDIAVVGIVSSFCSLDYLCCAWFLLNCVSACNGGIVLALIVRQYFQEPLVLLIHLRRGNETMEPAFM